MMQLLRQLFDVAGGGPETDAFKHIRAAFTVLRSLGTAATVSNPHSSRMVSHKMGCEQIYKRNHDFNINLRYM